MWACPYAAWSCSCAIAVMVKVLQFQYCHYKCVTLLDCNHLQNDIEGSEYSRRAML